jgi:hypothetical protein
MHFLNHPFVFIACNHDGAGALPVLRSKGKSVSEMKNRNRIS